jgi:hypothetical protein
MIAFHDHRDDSVHVVPCKTPITIGVGSDMHRNLACLCVHFVATDS